MTCPSDDLTKLSGPELADMLLDEYDGPVDREAARRLREDDRVWQRNLERERDQLRERVRELERSAEAARDRHYAVIDAGGAGKGTTPLSLPAERMPPFVWTNEDTARVVPGCTVVTRGCRVAVDGGHNEGYGDFLYGPGRSPTYDAMLCDPQSLLPPEPAERKAQEEQRYGGGAGYTSMTLAGMLSMYASLSPGSPIEASLIHLRETLATIDAVRALADGWKAHAESIRQSISGSYSMAAWTDQLSDELREVLNGKR